MALRILLADDRPVLLQGLQALLCEQQMDVVATALTFEKALELAAEHRPDIAVISDGLLFSRGMQSLGEFHAASRETHILVLGDNDPHDPMDTISYGISAYVQKTLPPNDLIQVIRQVARGMFVWGPEAARSRPGAGHPQLTPREREVLKLIAEGRSVPEAARILGLSAKTVEAHRTNLMRKLSIRESATLVRYAIRSKIVDI